MTENMDRHQRREMIARSPMPQPRHDAVVALHMDIGGTSVRLRYVPDRDQIDPGTFAAYLRRVFAAPAESLLSQAQTVLEDVNDQIIPCWLEVRLERTNADGVLEQALIEDKQPRWTDPGVLTRVGP